MSDSPTHKQQKTAKDEEMPNSLLSLPKDIVTYFISFVGGGHYWHVGSVCNKSTISMPMNVNTLKKNIWRNVAVANTNQDILKVLHYIFWQE
jgi:hypothetical protein